MLTAAQIVSILMLLQAFGVSQSTLNNVYTILTHGSAQAVAAVPDAVATTTEQVVPVVDHAPVGVEAPDTTVSPVAAVPQVVQAPVAPPAPDHYCNLTTGSCVVWDNAADAAAAGYTQALDY